MPHKRKGPLLADIGHLGDPLIALAVTDAPKPTEPPPPIPPRVTSTCEGHRKGYRAIGRRGPAGTGLDARLVIHVRTAKPCAAVG